MKRTLSLAALVAVGIVVGLLLRGFPVRQAVGGPPLTASQNGDVNDGGHGGVWKSVQKGGVRAGSRGTARSRYSRATLTDRDRDAGGFPQIK